MNGADQPWDKSVLAAVAVIPRKPSGLSGVSLAMDTNPDRSSRPSPAGNSAVPAARLRALEGRVVLVTPAASRENPPVGMRGALHVTPENEVQIVLQFADMFDRPAENKIIRLTPEEVSRLLTTDDNGVYSYSTAVDIQAPPVKDYVVKSPKL